MRRITKWLDAKLYPHYKGPWDARLFRAEIVKLLRKDAHVLDLGAGAGILSDLNVRGMAARVCGVDLDERVLENPYLDEAKIGMGEEIPYPDASFDVVFAHNVLEHLDRPELTFREVMRVIKPGGVFLIKTPNKRHYVPFIANLTPHAFHQGYNKLGGRQESDTFPTHYRVNTPAMLKKYGNAAGLQLCWVRMIEGRPEYLRMFPPAYLIGYLYERWVNLIPGFAGFRVIMIALLHKPASGGTVV